MKDKESKNRVDELDEFDYLAGSASDTECTGLMHKVARSDEELLAYEEVYDFLPPGGNMKK